jgi:hypothetical protein
MIALFAISLLFTNCGKETENIEEDSVIPEEPVLVEKYMPVRTTFFVSNDSIVLKRTFDDQLRLHIDSVFTYADGEVVETDIMNYYYDEEGRLIKRERFDAGELENKYEYSYADKFMSYDVIYVYDDGSEKLYKRYEQTFDDNNMMLEDHVSYFDLDGVVHSQSKKTYYYDEDLHQEYVEFHSLLEDNWVLTKKRMDFTYDYMKTPNADVSFGIGFPGVSDENVLSFTEEVIHDESENEFHNYVFNYQYNQAGYVTSYTHTDPRIDETTSYAFEYEVIEIEE